MRTRIFIVILLASACCLASNAQNNTTFTLLKGDTVRLEASGRGTVQWQSSPDSVSWTDIPGARSGRLSLVAEENTYLRAMFTEGSCDPVYSQTTFVRVRRDEERKNILFIFIDDMGWMDLGCYGSDYYETPNIDALAAGGVRFTQAYTAHSVCSPTRASVVTGKDPARLHITAFIPGSERDYARLSPPANWSKYLKMSETTYAEVLRDNGYRTFHAGKWHLGQLGPEYHGFDTVIPENYSTIDPEDPKNVMYYTGKTMEFIENNRDRPFIAVVSHHTVHVPLEGRPELIAKYESKQPGSNGQNNATMGAMIEYLDTSVGMLVDKLKELGLMDNTYIIFFSDNGGLASATSNKPLRSGKSQAYEGGIRVPMIVCGPGLPAGYTVNCPVISNDIFPTMLSMAGIPLMPEAHMDGLSLMPLLTGEKRTLGRENLFWYYPHYQTLEPHGAVRSGDWKLIEFFEQDRVELYDLANDLSESHDLSAAFPDKALELKQLLHNHLLQVGAQWNTENPNYDPARETESHYGPMDPSEFEQPEYLEMTGGQQVSIGLMRWDDWSPDDDPASPYNQGLECMKPKKWNELGYWPWWASLDTNGNLLELNENRPEIMEQENRYAYESRVDYWAFFRYSGEDNPMNQQFRRYLESPNKQLVRFCFIASPQVYRAGTAEIKSMVNYMHDPQYFRVLDDRPLIYFYLAGMNLDEVRDYFARVRQETVTAGLENPYVVLFNNDWEWSYKDVADLGQDAFSEYGPKPGRSEEGSPYQELIDSLPPLWASWAGANDQVVPSFSQQWDPRPYYEKPPAWWPEPDNQFFEPPTKDEFRQNVQNALDFVKEGPEKCPSRTIIIKEWNGFPEGAIICPSLKNGSAYIDALKEVTR